MVFIALNIIITLAFFFCTMYIDRTLQKITPESGNLIIPLLIVTVESLLFSVVLFFGKVWSESLIEKLLMWTIDFFAG
mgnify:CR=1 FL=1